MLRDITTNGGINTAIYPCTRHHDKLQNPKGNKRRVQFDAEGMVSFGNRLLMKAMAGEKKQKKIATLKGPKTPKKVKKAERFVIGSSSTWREEQLDRFKVRSGGQVAVVEIIPEKWFDFRGLEHYQSGLFNSVMTC
jgi:hypothetical protein